MILKQFAIDVANGFTKWNLWRGGGGSSTLASLEDVLIVNPAHGDTLKYNSIIGKWTNQDLKKYFIDNKTLNLYNTDVSISNNTLIINDTDVSISGKVVILNG